MIRDENANSASYHDAQLRLRSIANERRLVVLESPFAGKTQHDVDRNVAYARRCIHDCLARGEAPIASHLLFTQPGVLEDHKPEERELGIASGIAWYRVADHVVFYTDLGWSPGMMRARDHARFYGLDTSERSIGS